MRPSLASSVAQIWGPDAHIKQGFFGLCHVYLLGKGLEPAERSSVLNEVQRLSARGPNAHMGISHLYDKEVKPRADRKARTEQRKFVHPDEALIVINRAAEENRNTEQVRCGLMLMYMCGLSYAVVANLRSEDFLSHAGHLLLHGGGSLYVLTPSLRAVVEAWLAAAPVPERPFARMCRRFKPYAFLSESYNVVQSY